MRESIIGMDYTTKGNERCEEDIEGSEGTRELRSGSKWFEGFRRASKGFEGSSRVSTGRPMTVIPPSRSCRPDMTGAPGGREVGGREANAIKVEAVDLPGGTRVSSVKVSDRVGGVQVGSGFPGVFADSVAFPLDEVLDLSISKTAVEDGLHFELFVAVDDIGRGRRCDLATRKGIGRSGGELDDGEDGVQLAHRKWQFELVCTRSDTRFDFEGS